jgi:hypothetical protein
LGLMPEDYQQLDSQPRHRISGSTITNTMTILRQAGAVITSTEIINFPVGLSRKHRCVSKDSTDCKIACNFKYWLIHPTFL